MGLYTTQPSAHHRSGKFYGAIRISFGHPKYNSLDQPLTCRSTLLGPFGPSETKDKALPIHYIEGSKEKHLVLIIRNVSTALLKSDLDTDFLFVAFLKSVEMVPVKFVIKDSHNTGGTFIMPVEGSIMAVELRGDDHSVPAQKLVDIIAELGNSDDGESALP